MNGRHLKHGFSEQMTKRPFFMLHKTRGPTSGKSLRFSARIFLCVSSLIRCICASFITGSNCINIMSPFRVLFTLTIERASFSFSGIVVVVAVGYSTCLSDAIGFFLQFDFGHLRLGRGLGRNVRTVRR